MLLVVSLSPRSMRLPTLLKVVVTAASALLLLPPPTATVLVPVLVALVAAGAGVLRCVMLPCDGPSCVPLLLTTPTPAAAAVERGVVGFGREPVSRGRQPPAQG